MKSIFSLIVLSSIISFAVHSQQVMPLYESAIPNSKPAPDEEKESKIRTGLLLSAKFRDQRLLFFYRPKT